MGGLLVDSETAKGFDVMNQQRGLHSIRRSPELTGQKG